MSATQESTSITVIGAGILGLWQALTLARAGHRVRLIEASAAANPFAAGASRHAGAMLAPDCEAEAAPEIVRAYGHHGLALWRQTYPDLVCAGTLVVAAARDRSELTRFARVTSGHRTLENNDIAALEPDLAGRFAAGLHFPAEAHMTTPDAMAFLLKEVTQAVSGAAGEVRLGAGSVDPASVDGIVVDCRGLLARADIATLRGVRGEKLVVRAHDVVLSRPVRLLHPRNPIYVVPWRDKQFLIGATVLESEDDGPATVRSALELLGLAYALAPGFGEAEILDMGAGLRPAYPDNVPRVTVEAGGCIVRVNGAYRHGFLLAPVLAEVVANVIADAAFVHPLLVRA